ncbi:MAG: cyclic nucleotide-binding domain-containing protein [Candidatus Competibacter sp.]|nr:cyclic nucleotide-binding domain-containing protein [Candidatus Competibacter sp.]MDG4582608.1 cyclic nucleotide-binding domain-containing protein [Candidatus Competibacter sp.]
MPNRDLFKQIEEYRSFAAGQIIFREGEPGDNLYIVAEGEVDILVNDDHILETVGSGGIVGELALVDDKPRSATATARTDCVLAPVSRPHFLALVRLTPSFAIQVMRVMAERLRRTTHQLRD